MPANHGLRLHDGQGIQAAGPQTIEPDPKYPIEGCEPRPPVLLSLKDGQLVAQGENLKLELGTGPNSPLTKSSLDDMLRGRDYLVEKFPGDDRRAACAF